MKSLLSKKKKSSSFHNVELEKISLMLVERFFYFF